MVLYTHRGWPRAPGTGCPGPRQAARGRHTLQSPRLGPQSCPGWGWQGPGSRGTDRIRRSPPPPALGRQEEPTCSEEKTGPPLPPPARRCSAGLSAGTAPEGESLSGSGRGPPGEGTAVGCPWKWPQGLRDVARTEEARRSLLALLREASSPTCPAGRLREERSRGRLGRQGARPSAPLNPSPGL